ncbi:MAG: DUF4397 domain-containing protein [Polyangiales bacterium]
MNKASIRLALVAALGLATLGCGDDASSGSGGTGGSGGSGGTGATGGSGGSGGTNPGMAMVRVAHLAPDVPSAGDTNVDILVDGVTAIEDLEFAEATGFVELAAGDYEFGIAAAGSTDPVFEFPATLVDGAILTVVAYRTVASGDNAPVNVLVFDGSTDGLASGQGRVLVGHGADDTLLDPVDVITPAACPPPLLDDFMFGAVAGPLDLPASTVGIAFSLASDSNVCQADVGPLDAPVTADVVTLLIAVDNDTTDEALAPAVYALIDDFSGTGIPTLQASP